MIERLESLEKPATCVELEWGGHGLGNRPARARVLTSLEAFLEAAIGSEQSPESEGIAAAH